MKKPLIEVKGLVNQFGSHRVHDGLDFSIYPNQIVGIVGGSGTGKSVLLKSIIGLNKPTSGSIIINGQDFLHLDTAEMLKMQRLWGVLFQNGALFSSLNVRDNVALPIKEFTNIPEKMALELAEVKIELVGLPTEARTKYPSELSGGMVKRASLARALALDPKILFLDEPTAGLDPISAAAFDHLISELSKNLNLAVVMITHDLDSLFSICDRIAVIVDKKIKVDTLENHLKDYHPWIREYFHGERSRAVLREEE
jgi:phospholipid/cholesterol/gamma-HCH transport system ATP-binding protein